jgi:hypothetical protein
MDDNQSKLRMKIIQLLVISNAIAKQSRGEGYSILRYVNVLRRLKNRDGL